MSENTPVTDVKHDAPTDHAATAVGAVAVGRGPIGDIADAGRTIVVTNPGDDTVALLDADTLSANGVVVVPGEPFAVTVTDDRAYVSTTSANHDVVSVIDINTQTVIKSYPLAYSVTALAVSPNGKRVYVGRTGDNHVDVAVIDTTAERVGTIDIATGSGIGIDALAVDPSGRRLYVATTDTLGSRLVIADIETARVERAIPIGAPIRDIALADGTAYVLTSDRSRGGVVNVVDLSTGRITDTVDLGIGAPTQMTVSADDTRAYVVDYNRVAVLCLLTLKVVNTVTVDARPSCVTVDFDGGRLYVADYAGGVAAFSVASTLPLLYSQFMATDPISVAGLAELEPA